MPDVELAPVAERAASHSVDRRTLLGGAAGTVAAAGLSGPARAVEHAASLAARSRPRFDPNLAHQLQRALRYALRDPVTTAPGAIPHRGRNRFCAGARAEGRIGHLLFAIESGTADVVMDGATVRTIGAGDVVGEIAVFASPPDPFAAPEVAEGGLRTALALRPRRCD